MGTWVLWLAQPGDIERKLMESVPRADPKNTGTNQFQHAGVGFATARIIHRQGWDVAASGAVKDGWRVQITDNPDGADDYEIEISYGW